MVLMEKLLAFLSNTLEENQIAFDIESINEYGQDRTRFYNVHSPCIVFPKNTKEISTILAYCNQENISVVPSGGRTGLAGAAVAKNNEIVISMQKMNKIIEVDDLGNTVEVEAGVTVEAIQNACKEKGLFFPLDFAAKGSAQIGGCISTNAGGIKVIKYGMTRDLVLGLEVVLMDGSVLDLNRKLIKDNSGYALTQLFIGSEGTLGIISKAILKCVTPIERSSLGLFALNEFEKIPVILKKFRGSGCDILSFEFFSGSCKDIVVNHVPKIEDPFEETYTYYVLVELDSSDEQFEELMEVLAEDELILDATIASSSKEIENIWALREYISESISMSGNVYKNDISVPVSDLINFIPDLEEIVKIKYSEFELLLFGHIGDGNIHINILDKSRQERSIFKEKLANLDNEMYHLVLKHEGSISAEHGIGLLKKEGLKIQRSQIEIDLMRGLKEIFDKKSLLNPGKIFDPKQKENIIA
jgi:glycolate oxidase subunit GlcD